MPTAGGVQQRGNCCKSGGFISRRGTTMLTNTNIKTTEAEIRRFAGIDFNVAPFIVFWEITRACSLACRHCRAAAQPHRNPRELTTEEGIRLIDQIAALGTPLLIITGGDPIMRHDVFDFIRFATTLGIRVALAPSATPLVNLESLQKARDAGLSRMSLSLDGDTAETHDAFRMTPGSFDRTISILRDAQRISLSCQINTTVSRHNVHKLDAIARMIETFEPVLWDVFFLVPTGRGDKDDVISAEEHERVFNWLYDISKNTRFEIKTTAAEHYRRVVMQREATEKRERTAGVVPDVPANAGCGTQLSVGRARRLPSPSDYRQICPAPTNACDFAPQKDGLGRLARGINDGKGCCFISHIGEVCPSGFLPVVAGNVRQQSLADIYRNATIFLELRDAGRLKGKCGRCEYNMVCGGSRARAYAMTGDYLAPEPCCIYQPEASAQSPGQRSKSSTPRITIDI